MLLVQSADPLGGGDDAQDPHVGNAPAFQGRDGHADRTTCSEHRVEHKAHLGRIVLGKLAVVFDRLGGLLVTVHSQVPDFGVWDQFENWFDESESGSKDRDNCDTLSDSRDPHPSQRGIDFELG